MDPPYQLSTLVAADVDGFLNSLDGDAMDGKCPLCLPKEDTESLMETQEPMHHLVAKHHNFSLQVPESDCKHNFSFNFCCCLYDSMIVKLPFALDVHYLLYIIKILDQTYKISNIYIVRWDYETKFGDFIFYDEP